ncbi:MAG: nuclear transport factor 2 family protein [Actinomycetota bacterium]
MDNTELVRNYLDVAVPGQLQLDKLRAFLADDVTIDDPLMSIEGADAFVAALEATPTGGDMGATVEEVVGDGEVVAARVLFQAGDLRVQFSQWFWVADGRIERIQVIYDPRAFLAGAG